MQPLFAGYYLPSDEEFNRLWQEAFFVFDANVLLNLYRYSEATRQQFLDILASEELCDRIWIPNQAALEYQRNRLRVIDSQRAAYKLIREGLDEAVGQIMGTVLGKFKKHVVIDVEVLYREIEEVVATIKQRLEQLENEHPDFSASDPIREALDKLFEGKVGDAYSTDRLKQTYREGAERYSQDPKIPPGFEDAKDKKGTTQYGDLVVWFQIIDEAQSENKPVIFVTDDRKDDWWWKSSGRTLGPRPELVQEMSEKAKVPFYMYQADRFLVFANEFLDKNVEQSAIDEIKELREETEAEEVEAQAAMQATSAMLAEAVVEKAYAGGSGGALSSIEPQRARPLTVGEVIEMWRFWSDPENQKAVKNAVGEIVETYRQAFRFLASAFSEVKAASFLSQAQEATPSAPTETAVGPQTEGLASSPAEDHALPHMPVPTNSQANRKSSRSENKTRKAGPVAKKRR